jgi:TusA-related sulfurtransferase
MRCPLPIITSAKAIKEMNDGDSITLLSDDPATRVDLAAWSRMTGNESRSDGENRFTITKRVKQ